VLELVLEKKCNTDVIFESNILEPKVTQLRNSHLGLMDASAAEPVIDQDPDGVR
jgi:hypothetical protein